MSGLLLDSCSSIVQLLSILVIPSLSVVVDRRQIGLIWSSTSIGPQRPIPLLNMLTAYRSTLFFQNTIGMSMIFVVGCLRNHMARFVWIQQWWEITKKIFSMKIRKSIATEFYNFYPHTNFIYVDLQDRKRVFHITASRQHFYKATNLSWLKHLRLFSCPNWASELRRRRTMPSDTTCLAKCIVDSLSSFSYKNWQKRYKEHICGKTLISPILGKLSRHLITQLVKSSKIVSFPR